MGGSSPVPERLIDSGLSEALSVTVTVALRFPAAIGVNVTVMVHWAQARPRLRSYSAR